ncbi:MAG TPA: amino acid synthesis family protein, partial [Casimicrobiaceae bacterium]|nr:amino acid synthesis family protein [Casimicrobiaceae bacterium]
MRDGNVDRRAGRYVADLGPLVEASVAVGERIAVKAAEAMLPFKALGYGKGGVVGLNGEQEHGNALLTTAFAEPLRARLGGGKAWIS